jgi:hypothetical protein
MTKINNSIKFFILVVLTEQPKEPISEQHVSTDKTNKNIIKLNNKLNSKTINYPAK